MKQNKPIQSAAIYLAALLAAPFTQAAVVANWTMNDADVSGTIVNDIANSNNGTLTNGATTGVSSPLGQAANFDGGGNNGNNNFIDFSSSIANLALPVGTIAAWIKPETQAGDVLTIFSTSNTGTGSAEARFFVSNGGSFGVGNLAFGTRGSGVSGSAVSSGVDLFDGGWHHVAVTVDAANALTLYIDGVANGTGTSDFLDIPSANAAAIGRNKDSTGGGGQWFYHGLIDDVLIDNEALSAVEVAALAAVPEPSSSLLIALSGLVLLVRRRR